MSIVSIDPKPSTFAFPMSRKVLQWNSLIKDHLLGSGTEHVARSSSLLDDAAPCCTNMDMDRLTHVQNRPNILNLCAKLGPIHFKQSMLFSYFYPVTTNLASDPFDNARSRSQSKSSQLDHGGTVNPKETDPHCMSGPHSSAGRTTVL